LKLPVSILEGVYPFIPPSELRASKPCAAASKASLVLGNLYDISSEM